MLLTSQSFQCKMDSSFENGGHKHGREDSRGTYRGD